MDILTQTVVLLGELPGSLVYHLVLLFALEMAAFLAFSSWRRARAAASARMFLATLVLALLFLASLVVTILAAFGLLQGLLVLPPLARAVDTLTVLVVVWACAFPQPSRLADVFTLLLVLVALAAGVVSTITWAQALAGGAAAYNGTLDDNIWGWAQVALIAVGLLLLVVRRRNGWLIGLLALLVLALGQIVHLSFLWPGTSLPGTVRLAELVAVPLFTALAYRRVVGEETPLWPEARPTPAAPPNTEPAAAVIAGAMPASAAEVAAAPEEAAAPPAEVAGAAPHRTLDPKAAVALASLNASVDPDELAQIVTLAVAHSCRAELCLLISPPDDLGMCSLICAYDLVREQFIAGTFFSAADLPAVRAAVAHSAITHLSPAEHGAELRRLNGAVGIGPIGPTLIAPLFTEHQRLGALVLVALYSHRAWRAEDENLLSALLGPITDALSGDNQVNRLLRDLEKTQSRAQTAEEAERGARTEADQLSVALEAARGEAERLNQAILQLRQDMDQLKPVDEVDNLRSTLLAENANNFAEIEADWRARLETAEQQAEARTQQVAGLQAELDRARDQLRDSQHQRGELASELEPLRANLAGFAAQSAELERLRAELEAARAQPAAVVGGPRDPALEAQLEALHAESAALRGRLARQAEAEATHAKELDSERERLRADLAAAQAQTRPTPAGAPSAREAELQEELTHLRAELERANDQVAQYIGGAAGPEPAPAAPQPEADWRAQLAAAQQELQAQLRRADQLQAELDQARTTAAPPDARAQHEVNAERVRLEAQIKELREFSEAQHWQLATFKFDYDFALQQEEQLRKELELTRAELRHLSETPREPAPAAAAADTQALAQAQAAVEAQQSELAQSQAALAEARQELASKERQLSKAQNVVASLNDQARQLTEVQAEMDELRSALAEAQTALEDVQGQLGDKDNELANAMAALAELASQTHTLTLTQKQLADKERQLAEAQAALPASAATETEAVRPFLPEASMEVIASLSQELRQPMAAIVGYSELLLSESVGILGALQRKFLERIKASCERMEGLLGDLIRVTDIDAGTLQLVPESLDVMYVLEDAILSCGAQFREKGINLRLDIADQLPSLSADRDAVRQIVAHLLSNAGNASGNNGEVVLKVRAETDPAAADPASHALLIAVRDSGGGIAPEDQSRVFSRFYRADSPLISGLGETGVGLSVAKALVEAHGGRIWLTSDPGQGSTFTVVLPLHGKNGTGPLHLN